MRINVSLFDDYDHWILTQLQGVTSAVEKCFTGHDVAPLTHIILHFLWSDFCDWYVEACKGKLKCNEAVQGNCLAIQDLVLRQVLQLANP